MSITTIDPSDLQRQLSSDPTLKLLDVRTPVEFETIRAQSAHNVPLDQLDASRYVEVQLSKLPDGTPLYVICKMGGRSLQACEKFVAAGFSNVVNVTGGTDAWHAAGLPVIQSERKTLPLDCQVRLAAGVLVLIGAGLSFLNPWWALLPMFIGAGLAHSGATNTCAILPMVAKMPWNRVSQKPKVDDAGGCDTGG